MNNLIEKTLKGFTVNGKGIPVKFLRYNGSSDTYITYMMTDADSVLHGDDELLNYVEYYDFDIYTKGNYRPIVTVPLWKDVSLSASASSAYKDASLLLISTLQEIALAGFFAPS